jgi:hypothetical protein
MTVLSAIRERFSAFSPFSPSESARDASAGAVGDGDGLPFAGYDRLDDKRVVAGLSDNSQPLSATSVSSAPGDRPEKSGGS